MTHTKQITNLDYCPICMKLVKGGQCGITCNFGLFWYHAHCLEMCTQIYNKLCNSLEN